MSAPGKRWRSLEEYADTAEFREWLHREFPPLASEWPDGVSRRRFLELMGASFALAGLGACTRQPVEKIVPYVQQPEGLTPGKPLHFASATTLGGYARGIVVQSHEGRPTKIEGNPAHPASLGRTDAMMQAAILDLYDPGRSRNVLERGEISTWDAFRGVLTSELAAQERSRGKGLRILTGTVTSPTLAAQLGALLARYPAAHWHVWEAVHGDNAREGARLAFGEPVECLHHFEQAEVIVSLGADFLGAGPAQVRNAHDFAQRRRIVAGNGGMSRLYVAEATPTITGAMADERLAMRESALAQLAMELQTEPRHPWAAAAARDLAANRGASLVLAGDEQPPEVHARAHHLNAKFGNVGKTVAYLAPADARPVNRLESLRSLVGAMKGGVVELLVVLAENPAFDAPADFGFAERMGQVKTCIHLGTEVNETAMRCQWHLPAAHFLEGWSDARAMDGTASIIQPLIEPLHGGRTAHELMAAMLGTANPSSYEIVRDFWASQKRWADFDAGWRQALQDGVIAGSAAPAKEVALRELKTPTRREGSGLELVFRADPAIYDGRMAGNAWLRELPKPLTKLVWDNAVLIAPKTAARLGLKTNDNVELTHEGRRLAAPIFILPGHAEEALTLHLGHGRSTGNRVATQCGFNAYALRGSGAIDVITNIGLQKAGGSYPLVTTQQHFSLEGRNLLRTATVGEFQKNPEVVREMGKAPGADETMYVPPPFASGRYAWAMAIDLTVCTGCNACVMACQAENNIPVVGKEEVGRGREMHWIRIDTYFEGAPESPRFYFQPVPCMHCENAPCELVCPVAATVHDHDGLNLQVYNRCIGTRYCSNNCPYKVRRFNFFEYNGKIEPIERLGKNPEVTLRTRGVMEKCTYCVQRIEVARVAAEKENRRVREGEVVPACAQACPAGAIVFGDLTDHSNRVVALKATPLNYAMLEELNTRPRTTYLARITNPGAPA